MLWVAAPKAHPAGAIVFRLPGARARKRRYNDLDPAPRGARARPGSNACPPAGGRAQLMRALPTELARKLAANPRFRPAPASSLIIVGASGSEAERFSPHRRSEGLPSGGGTGQLGTSALVLVHLRHSRQTAPTCAQVAARQLLRPRGQTSRRAANGWRGRSWPREKSSNLLLCSAASRHARNNPAQAHSALLRGRIGKSCASFGQLLVVFRTIGIGPIALRAKYNQRRSTSRNSDLVQGSAAESDKRRAWAARR
jgi:hypothetical protein